MPISVCIPTYNGEKFIYAQIFSILSQLSEDDEIIISDNESTDKTIEIIQSFNDPRIKIYIFPKKEKYKFSYELTTYNIENALNKSVGKYIFLADQDDIWLPDKVKDILPFFSKYDLILHDSIVVDEKENVVWKSYFDYINAKQGIVGNLIKNSYTGCCMAFKREVMLKSLPFPNFVPHDLWIALNAEKYFKTYFFEKPLIKYRRHSDTLTTTSSKSKNNFAFKLYYRFYIVTAYLKKILG